MTPKCACRETIIEPKLVVQRQAKQNYSKHAIYWNYSMQGIKFDDVLKLPLYRLYTLFNSSLSMLVIALEMVTFRVFFECWFRLCFN